MDLPLTALALSAALTERNVREWLGGMTAASIVGYDPGAVSWSCSTPSLPGRFVEMFTVPSWDEYLRQ